MGGGQAGAAPGFCSGRGRNIGQFFTLIPLKSCTAIALTKISVLGTFNKIVLSKAFKIREFIKIYKKYLHKNLKILQNLSKIKFKRIKKI